MDRGPNGRGVGGGYIYDDGNAKAQTDLAARLADNDQKLAEAQKRLETFQDALKSGERVLSPEEHEAAIKTAKDDQQVALDEVKHQQEDASTADHDADEHDAEAQKADALANSPPGNMGDAERAAYVKDKNDDAQKAPMRLRTRATARPTPGRRKRTRRRWPTPKAGKWNIRKFQRRTMRRHRRRIKMRQGSLWLSQISIPAGRLRNS